MSVITHTYVVNCSPSPVVSINGSALTNTICAGSAANLVATCANAYSWSTGASGARITVNPPVTTIYSVIGSSGVGCQATASATVNVINCVALPQQDFLENVVIFPNPATSTLYLKGVLDNASFIQLTDISGRIVLSIGAEQVSEIDLRALSSGICTLTYTTGKKAGHWKVSIARYWCAASVWLFYGHCCSLWHGVC